MNDVIAKAIEASREREKAPLHPTLLSDWDEESLRVAYLNGGLARAVYQLQCRYVGPKHEEVSVRLIEDALIVSARAHEPRFREALAVAVKDLTLLRQSLERSSYTVIMFTPRTPTALTYVDDALARIAAILEGKP